MDYLTIGKIVNTHALKGELKIKSNTDFDRYKKGNKVILFLKNEQIELTVKSHRIHKNHDLVVFEGLEDINLVERFKGHYLKILKDNLDVLEDDEFYYYELIGFDVVNKSNNKLGVVTEILELPQGEIIVIENNGVRSMIPFNDTFVHEINDKIIINEIEGLINED